MDASRTLRDIGRRLTPLRDGPSDVRLLVDLDVPHARCCNVIRSDGRRLPVEDIPDDALDALRGIRAGMVAAGGDAWSRCVYILEQDGTFHLGIEYPVAA